MLNKGQTIIDSYNFFEDQHKLDTSIFLYKIFTPDTFNKGNFLTEVKSSKEFWKFADTMQELRTAIYASEILKVFSSKELDLIRKTSLEYGTLIKIFKRKTNPVGINHQLSSIPTLRIIESLKDKLGENPSIFEVGGGTGMLGHMCYRLGFKYTNFEVTKSFYTFNAMVLDTMYKNNFNDTHALKTEDLKKIPGSDSPMTMIPWWHFSNTEVPLPKFNIVVMNHCFFEMSRGSIAFLFTRLSYEVDGRVFLIVSEWGSRKYTEIDNDFLYWLEKEFDFRIEEFCGDPKINPAGTVFLSFAKKNPKKNYNYLPINERLGIKLLKNNNTKVKEIKKLFSRYIPHKVKIILKNFLVFSGKRNLILGLRNPKFSKTKINILDYNKDYNDLKNLITEIEKKLGSAIYTEDELKSFYTNTTIL